MICKDPKKAIWFGDYELHDIIDKLNTFNSLESRIKLLESRLRLLEDNAFSDRARIGMLENKIEALGKESK